jgi:hypothetical protein
VTVECVSCTEEDGYKFAVRAAKVSWEVSKTYADLEELASHPSVQKAVKAARAPITLPAPLEAGAGADEAEEHSEEATSSIRGLAHILQASSVPRAALEPLYEFLEVAKHEHAVSLEPAGVPAAPNGAEGGSNGAWLSEF